LFDVAIKEWDAELDEWEREFRARAKAARLQGSRFVIIPLMV
jgi:hypothetical protein